MLRSLYLTVLTVQELTPLQLAGICDYAENADDAVLLQQLARHPALDADTDSRLARRPEAAVRVAWISRPGRDAAAVRDVLGQERRTSILAAVAALSTIDDVLRSELSAINHPKIAEALVRSACAPRAVELAAYRTLAAAATLTLAASELLTKALADGEILASVAGVVSSGSVERVVAALAKHDLQLADEAYQHLFDVVSRSADLRAKAQGIAKVDSQDDWAPSAVSAVQMLQKLADMPGAPPSVTAQVQELVHELCALAGLGQRPERDRNGASRLANALAEAWFNVADAAALSLTCEAAQTCDAGRLAQIAAEAIDTENKHAAAAVLLNPNVDAATVAALWSTPADVRRRVTAAAVAHAHQERSDILLTLLDLSGPLAIREIVGAVNRPDRLIGQYLGLLAACGPDIVPIKQGHFDALLDLPQMTADLLRRVPARAVANYRPRFAHQSPTFAATLAEVLQPAAENRLVASALAALAACFDGRLGDLVAAAEAAAA